MLFIGDALSQSALTPHYKTPACVPEFLFAYNYDSATSRPLCTCKLDFDKRPKQRESDREDTLPYRTHIFHDKLSTAGYSAVLGSNQ